MIRVTLIALALCLAGCETMRPTTQALELAHGVLIAADTAQTMQGQNAPDCYREADHPAVDLFGAHPSTTEIIGYGALHLAAHAVVSDWLDRKIDADDDDGWRIIRTMWHTLTFATEIKTVVDNHREGLGLGFSRVPQRCLDARARMPSRSPP
jgi:hypothetical protein